MRTPWLLIVGLAVVTTTACKKPQPSPEYAQAMATHASLYGRLLDDAYLDLQMAKVEAMLAQVPQDSADFSRAQALLSRIQAERARVTAEREKRDRAIAAAMAPLPFKHSDVELDAESAQAAVDAGSPQPAVGMLLAEFQNLFAGCFAPGIAVEISGEGAASTYQLKDIANCRDRHAGFGARLVLVKDGKVHGFVERDAVRMERRLPDGGAFPDAGV